MKSFFRYILKIVVVGTVLFSFANGCEKPTEESLTRLYVATFDRAPDKAGIDYWLYQSFGGNACLEQIAQSFFDQNETQQRYPQSLTTDEFVKAIYKNLFNREPDTAGLQYWVGELSNNNIKKSEFILAVINGALSEYGDENDKKILANKTEVGLYFANSNLNSVIEAKDVMSGVTGDDITVQEAIAKIEYITHLSDILFSKVYELNIINNSQSSQLIVNDGAPTSGTNSYILGGTVTVDQLNTNNRGDDALIMQIDKDSGDILDIYYARYKDDSINPIYKQNESIIDIDRSWLSGNIALLGSVLRDGSYSSLSAMIINLSSTGGFKWGAIYKRDDAVDLKAIKYGGDAIYAVGNAYIPIDNNGNKANIGIFVKIDEKSGDILDAKAITSPELYYDLGYGTNGGDTWNFNGIDITNSGIYISGTSQNAKRGTSALVVKLDLDGNFIYAKEFNRLYNDNYLTSRGDGIIVTDSGIFLVFEDNEYSSSFINTGLINIDADGNIKSAKTLLLSSPYSYYRGITISYNGKMYLSAGGTNIELTSDGLPQKSIGYNGAWSEGVFVDLENSVVTLSFNSLGGTHTTMYVNRLDYSGYTCDKFAKVEEYKSYTDITKSFETYSYTEAKIIPISLDIDKEHFEYQDVTLDIKESSYCK